MEYLILQNDSSTKLGEWVATLVGEGWTIQGGVSYVRWTGDYPGQMFSQAMIKNNAGKT